MCAPAPPKRHKEPWKKKLLAVDGVTLCTTTPRCSCRSRPRLLLLLDGSVLLWDVELAEGADDLRGGRGGGIAEAEGWDCDVDGAGGQRRPSLLARLLEDEGSYAGLAGCFILSTCFGRLASNGPLELCSWASLVATAIFAGQLSELIL